MKMGFLVRDESREADYRILVMGYSGITVSAVKVGYKAYKASELSCQMGFLASRLTFNATEEDGICLEPGTTFQELLSWVL